MAADIEKYPFSFINTPSSLQSLSLTEVALALWRYKYRTNSSFPSIWPSTFLQQKVWSCREMTTVTVPSPIVAKIDGMIFSLGAKLREWFELYVKLYHCDRNFAETFRIFFEHIVIDCFGSISLGGTATNIVNLAKLSDVENYKIACTFCLEDQVGKFWPSVAKDIEFDIKSRYDEWNLLFYWNSRMNKSGGGDSLVTIRMNTAACLDCNWPAFEYFWKTVSKRRRVSQAILFLKHGYDQAAIRSLPTLNQIQAAKVFEATAAEILRILIPKEQYFQHVDRLAALVGHEVLKKESCFFDVLFVLWKMVFNPNPELDLNYAKCDQINELMLKIWSKARDRLKAYVWNNRVLEFVTELSEGVSEFSCYYGHSMEFILELLRNSQNVNKEQLWRNNWRRLALRAKPEYLKQFVEVCLPNNDDEAIIETFKEQMTHFGDLFTSLVYNGFYSDLRDHLLFCSKNDDDFRLLSRRTLESNSVPIILQNDDDKLEEFNRFVDEIFSKVKDDVDEFKEQMISSSRSLLILHDSLILNGSIDFQRTIGRFVTSEVRLKRLRCKMLDHLRDYLVGYLSEQVFYADQWQKLLEWCNDEEGEEEGGILEFRRSLNVYEIFLKHLAYYRDYGFDQHCTTRKGKLVLHEGYSCLSFFDGFLKWYFKNDEERVKFKLDTINDYDQIDDICKMMEGGTIWDRTKMYYLLNWFFDNDDDKVREFCEKWREFFETTTRKTLFGFY